MPELYNLILVDDEDDIRDGLKDMIDWESIGFRVAAAFSDGDKALEYVLSNPVDTVLTDVNMTSVSGLALARGIRSSKPDIKVVILSGYKQFEYVKSAMEYSVEAYLLKPTNLSEVEEIFAKIKLKIDEEEEERKRSRQIIERLERTNMFLKQEILSKLFSGEYAGKKEELRKSISVLNDGTFLSGFCCVYNIQYPENTDDGIVSTLQKFFNKKLPGVSFSSYSENGRIVLLACAENRAEDVPAQCDIYINSVCKKIKSVLGTEITAELSGSYQNIFEFADSINKSGESHYSGDDEVILQTMEYIDENYMKEIQLADVAGHVHLSEFYFSRLFKKKTGETFTECLKRKRVHKAMELLRNKAAKLDDVCEQVGYKSTKYFVKIFAEVSGMSVSEYRKHINKQ